MILSGSWVMGIQEDLYGCILLYRAYSWPLITT